MCTEVQPRRGRNLPPNSLDSRAKKLNPQDRDDYDFSLRWLAENANDVYKDPNPGLVLGLSTMTEVSLCKAHSSALYRAKKKHDNINSDNINGLSPPPSPSESTHEVLSHHPGPGNVMPHDFVPTPSTSSPLMITHSSLSGSSGEPSPSPSFSSSIIPTSTISSPLKRKRGRPAGSMSSQLPTSSTKQANLVSHLASLGLSNSPTNTFASSNNRGNNMQVTSPTLLTRGINSMLQPLQPRMGQHAAALAASGLPSPPSIVETISLRAQLQPSQPPQYFLRNLAITNNFTFSDCLREIDGMPPPPQGKKIVILSAEGDRTYPMGTPIRSVIPAGMSGGTHVELVLALVDVPTVDWNRI